MSASYLSPRLHLALESYLVSPEPLNWLPVSRTLNRRWHSLGLLLNKTIDPSLQDRVLEVC